VLPRAPSPAAPLPAPPLPAPRAPAAAVAAAHTPPSSPPPPLPLPDAAPTLRRQPSSLPSSLARLRRPTVLAPRPPPFAPTLTAPSPPPLPPAPSASPRAVLLLPPLHLSPRPFAFVAAPDAAALATTPTSPLLPPPWALAVAVDGPLWELAGRSGAPAWHSYMEAGARCVVLCGVACRMSLRAAVWR